MKSIKNALMASVVLTITLLGSVQVFAALTPQQVDRVHGLAHATREKIYINLDLYAALLSAGKQDQAEKILKTIVADKKRSQAYSDLAFSTKSYSTAELNKEIDKIQSSPF